MSCVCVGVCARLRVCSYMFIMQVVSNVDCTQETNASTESWLHHHGNWVLFSLSLIPCLCQLEWQSVRYEYHPHMHKHADLWLFLVSVSLIHTHTHIPIHIKIRLYTVYVRVCVTDTKQSWSKHEFLHNAHFTLAALVLHPLIHSHFILKDYNSPTDYCHSDHWYKTTHINTYAHSNEIHIYIVMAIHPLFSPKTSDRLAKSSPSCCLDNPEEYFLVAMTTDDAHPVWLAGFYLDA